MGDSVKKFYMSKASGDVQVTIDSYLFPEFVKKDKYVQEVKDIFEQRSQTGIKKYNTTLERDDVDLLGWLTHLQEELMDATLYIQKLKSEVTKDS